MITTASFFGVNAADVVWAHAVNDREKLDAALTSTEVMMLEADIMWCQTRSCPVMAHPPTVPPDATTFDEWLSIVLSYNSNCSDGKMKGIKLDFKSPETVEPCLLLLADIVDKKATEDRCSWPFPLWLNADVLKGPGSEQLSLLFDADVFIDQCQKFITAQKLSTNDVEVVLSLGWITTVKDKSTQECYSLAMIQEMVNLCKKKNVKQVSFPVCTIYIQQSWPYLEQLLDDNFRMVK
ncbi:DUF2181 domain containing protein [Balamuthia mandrillaris]